MAVRNRRWFATLILATALLGSSCSATTDSEEASTFTVGLITNNSNGMQNVQGFIDGMTDQGYVEGSNIHYLFAGEPVPSGDLDLALSEMIEEGVDLIFTAGTPTGVAAHRVTESSGVPVIFGVIADPIAAGVITDLSQPGGNLTGVKLAVDQGKRLELLLEMKPAINRIFVPFNPADSAATTAVDQISALALGLDVELVLAPSLTDLDVVSAIEDLSSDIDAIFLVPDSLVNAHLSEIVAAAAGLNIPTSGPSTAQVEEGALTAFGFAHHAAGFQAARIADQVLRGANPGDLPVQDTESFLAVNLATAAAIGLEIPEAILQRASIIVRIGDSG